MTASKSDSYFDETPETKIVPAKTSKITGLIPRGRRLNMRRLAIISFAVLALILTVAFLTKPNPTTFSVKEKGDDLPPCTNECEFEGQACENDKVFECVIREDGCRHKNLVEPCPEGSICSTLKKGTCYKPQTCDFGFHTCVTETSYKLCKNGKTIEGAETKECPEKLVCNKKSKQFALCVEK